MDTKLFEQFLREGQSSPFFYELPARRRPVSLDRLAVPASEERHAWSTSMN